MRNLFYLIIFFIFSLSIDAQVAPTAAIVKTSSLNCTGTAITYSAVSVSSPVNYTWAVFPTKDLVAFSDLNSPTVSLTFSSTTHHTIYLSCSDNSVNTSTSFTTLVLYQKPNATFNASFNSPGFPTELILTNYSTNFKSNFWSYSDSQGDSALNTVKYYPSSGSYTVTLLTFGDKGCKDSSSYDFVLSNNSSLILPNIFTPNGDGANDIYRPISQGLSYLNAKVCNRFGVLVTSWHTIDGFWDGYTISGESCSEGVYFIVVDAKGFDGQDYKLNTTITLAR